MKIAVSGKGGVGKSTIAGVLAHYFARSGYRVLAVDADPDANLASALGIPKSEAERIVPISEQRALVKERTGASPRQFGQLFKLNPRVDDIPEEYSFTFRGIKLLVMGAVRKGGEGCACPENVLLKSLLSEIILRRDEAVIVDMEAGIEHLGRATASAIQEMIIVVEPGTRSIETALTIMKLSRDIGLKKFRIIGNKVQNDDQERWIRSRFPPALILGMIPYSESIRDADRNEQALIDILDDRLREVFKSIFSGLRGDGIFRKKQHNCTNSRLSFPILSRPTELFCDQNRARSIMSFTPQGLATAIGSLPHLSPEAACRVILESIPEIPIWPQLPAVDFREGMEIQYSEGLPGVVLDPVGRRMHFDTGGDITPGLEKFYENYLAENLDCFRISPDFSRGIYEMERMLAAQRPSGLLYFKNQVTGPITIGLGRTDENKRSIYYNEMMRDVVVKGAEMKARWLLSRFRKLEVPQLCFIDEPILSAFGSSTYVSLQRPDVVQYLRDVIAAVHKEGGLAGIHCCGNTEWTMLIDAGTDVISFDAFDYGETIAYYPGPIKEYLESGGVLAWGIIPTSAKINAETAESLVARLRSAVGNLAGKGIPESLIWEKCLVTPSCGTGSLSVDLAEKIFVRLAEVSRRLRA